MVFYSKRKQIVLLSLLCVIATSRVLGQSDCGDFPISVYARNKISVTNNSDFSHTLRIRNTKKIIPPHSVEVLDFRLSFWNVKKTPIEFSYTNENLSFDYSYIESSTEREKYNAGTIALIAGMVNNFLKGKLMRTLFIAYLHQTVLGQNMSAETFNELCEDLYKIYNSDISDDAKKEEARDVVTKALYNCYRDLSENIKKKKDSYKKEARAHMEGFEKDTAYASDCIHAQERSHLEISGCSIPFFSPGTFKKVDFPNNTRSVDYFNYPAYSLRASYNYNAYAKHRRKENMRYFLSVQYTRSSAVHNFGNGTVNPNIAYAWDFFSAGIGYEGYFDNLTQKNKKVKNRGSAFVEIGGITNIFHVYNLTQNNSIGNEIKTESFLGGGIYLNVGLKIKIIKFVDIYGSYYAAGTASDKEGNMPSFGMFSLGLNFNLIPIYSYQY